MHKLVEKWAIYKKEIQIANRWWKYAQLCQKIQNWNDEITFSMTLWAKILRFDKFLYWERYGETELITMYWWQKRQLVQLFKEESDKSYLKCKAWASLVAQW